MIYLQDPDFTLYNGDVLDVLRTMPDESVDCCITSPPYMDARPEYDGVIQWRAVLRELRRVVTGPLAINVGRLWRNGEEWLWWTDILANRGDWVHRDTLVWVKPNANPIHGRIFTNAHEYVLLLGDEWYPDALRHPYSEESIARMGRRWINGRGVKNDVRETQNGRDLNPDGARPRSFVSIPVGREKGNPHPAPMAEELAKHLLTLCSRQGHTIIDPFLGSGTTALVARKHGRRCVGIELNEDYCAMAAKRLAQQSLFSEAAA